MRYQSVRPLFEPFLLAVERPGRYLGLERNVTRKDLGGMAVTVCLAFPDAYEIGMSHTGTKILYEIVNRRPGWACERTYAPWVDFEAILRREKVPLFSVESFAPVSDFDVVGFSLQSELNYTNVPNMLELSGIPVLARERGDAHPIVIGGGPCVANPEPLADFFDVFLIGDAEEALPVFLDEGRGHGGAPPPRAPPRLRACPGIYVPSLYDVLYDGDRVVSTTANAPGVPEKVRRVWVEKLSADVYPRKPMVPSVDIVQDRLGLEIMRGCTQGCRFCQAGYWYRPVRELDPADVAKATKAFIDEAGWSEVGLLSLSSADYSQIEPLVACLAPELAKTKVSISLPSLRAEAFSVGLADAVSEVRKSGFTFAPETGSDRLRRVINKTFTNADMVKAADVAFSRGWDMIKVYTMIGLPTETEPDLDELVTLVKDILAQGKKTRRSPDGERLGRIVRPEELHAVPVVRVRRRREPGPQARVSEGEVPLGSGREDDLARAEGGRDRGDALARRPAHGRARSSRSGNAAGASTRGASTSRGSGGTRRSRRREFRRAATSGRRTSRKRFPGTSSTPPSASPSSSWSGRRRSRRCTPTTASGATATRAASPATVKTQCSPIRCRRNSDLLRRKTGTRARIFSNVRSQGSSTAERRAERALDTGRSSNRFADIGGCISSRRI